MAFCAKCGAQLNAGSGFCAACGTAVSGQGTAGASAAPATAPAQSSAGAPSAGMTNNVVACLAYLVGWVTGLIFLVIEPYKNDKFVRFHAFQSIFYDVAVFALWMAIWIVGGILTVVSHGLFGPLMFLIGLLFFFAFIAGKILLMVKAYGNQQFKLPFIGDLAAKQAGV
jgi:uncharacterized membrane protein